MRKSLKSKSIVVFLVTFLVLFGGCKNDVTKSGSSDAPLLIAPYQRSAITLLSADGKNSKACSFEKFTGQMTMKKDLPDSVTFSVQTDSMATSDKKLVELLKDKDFFDVQKFPLAEFKSSEIKKDNSSAAAPNAYMVSGNLDIKGKKIKMNVPASMEVNEKEVSLMIQLPISNKDWLANFSTSPDAFFKDHLDVVAKLVFPKPVKVEEVKNREIKVDQKTFDAIKQSASGKQDPILEKNSKDKQAEKTGKIK